MRLRTEILDGKVNCNTYTSDDGDLFDLMREVTEMQAHDAAVAHALLRAINEYRADRGFILDRADEILAGWGYPNTEYSADIGTADRKGG